MENPGRTHVPTALKRAYTGPQLSLAPRIWQVLAPVRMLLPGLSPFVVRQLAREIGRQLDQGVESERIRHRLEHRYASTEAPRDVGRWLLGAAVVRHGCGLVACESGVIWRTGARCEVCADQRAARERPNNHPPRPGPAWHECAACQGPSHEPLPGGICRPCRPTAGDTR